MKNRWTWSLTLIVVVLLSSLSLPTQTRAAGNTLELLNEVAGTLSDQAPEQSYAVNFLAGQVFSVQVWPKSGDLQLEMEVMDASGASLAQSVPVDVVPGAALLEAVEAPEAGDYSIIVRRMGATAGDFGLMVLPGFGNLSMVDYFDGTGYNTLHWCECDEPDFVAGVADGEYNMEVRKANTYNAVRSSEVVVRDALYVEVTIRLEENRPRYYGFAFNTSEDGQEFYVVSITRAGMLDIFAVLADSVVDILPFQANPLIDANASTVKLGVLFQDYTFTVYFNDQVIGQVTEDQQLLPPGEMGLIVETVNNEESLPLSIHFDNLVITEPLNTAVVESAETPVDAETIGSILDQSRAGVDIIGLNPKQEYPMMADESRAIQMDATR